MDEKEQFKAALKKKKAEKISQELAEGKYGKVGQKVDMAKEYVNSERSNEHQRLMEDANRIAEEANRIAKNSNKIAKGAKTIAKTAMWISCVISIFALVVSFFK